MSVKMSVLMALFAVFSACLGSILGLLDIFGFLDGRHTISFTLLLFAAAFLYFNLICIFLLNLTDRKHVFTYIVPATFLFVTTFFIAHGNILISTASGVFYFIFMYYAFTESIKRSLLYVKFSPREIFFPILRNAITFFLIIITFLAYYQSQRLVSENSLISSPIIRTASKPTIIMLNQQINSQLEPVLSSPVVTTLPLEQRNEVIYNALGQTVTAMANPQTGEIYGIPAREFKVRDVSIGKDGVVDITPMIERMLPTIAFHLNEQLQAYAVFAPFIVALIVFVFFQPLMIPLQFLESYTTLILFQILKSLRFLHIKKETREIEIPYI